MSVIKDFRAYAFKQDRVDASGRFIGKKIYWKLYAVENIVRVLIHSILTIQAAQNWWDLTVDEGLRIRTSKAMANYKSRPWHSTPGKHPIYYTYLSDLSQILAKNSHLFKPIIPDIDDWVAKIEQVRLPRNIVGHMNWLTDTDTKRIDVCLADLQALIWKLETSGYKLLSP